jgi:hypothetical protein
MRGFMAGVTAILGGMGTVSGTYELEPGYSVWEYHVAVG